MEVQDLMEDLTDIRNISSEINLLPMVHGSSLFLRGETQVLNVTTLGMSRLEQMLDTIDTVTSKRYMHHYNFPPYSTGEAYMMRGPKEGDGSWCFGRKSDTTCYSSKG